MKKFVKKLVTLLTSIVLVISMTGGICADSIAMEKNEEYKFCQNKKISDNEQKE